MSSEQGDIPGAIENGMIDRPYVVVRNDYETFRVAVLAHCRSLNEAQHVVDEYTKDPTKVENVIVSNIHLRSYLSAARHYMAKRMETALGVS